MRERIESLFHACAAGDRARVEQILDDGYHDVNGGNRWATDIDPRGWERTPLHVAIEAGHLDLARWLLEQGADVNRKNRFGDTALAAICRPPLQGHWVAATELLIAHGANPMIKNDEDESALDLARKIPANWERVRHLFAKHEQT